MDESGALFVLDGSEFFMEPTVELSRLAAEQFLDWEKPPERVRLHRLPDGRWAVEAFGGHET
jgi:hypothetical protein